MGRSDRDARPLEPNKEHWLPDRNLNDRFGRSSDASTFNAGNGDDLGVPMMVGTAVASASDDGVGGVREKSLTKGKIQRWECSLTEVVLGARGFNLSRCLLGSQTTELALSFCCHALLIL
jgi:hypothetical protein